MLIGRVVRSLRFAGWVLLGALAMGGPSARAQMPGGVVAVPEDGLPRPGTLVIAGGGLRAGNEAVWSRIVAAAGGARARIAVIAAAAADPQRSAQRAIETLARYGAEGFFVPAAPRLKDSDPRRAANDPEIDASVRGATGVYFTGGDQGRITATLIGPEGDPTPLLLAVRAVYERGGVIAGSSAGAAIMSTTMFFEPPDEVLPIMLSGARSGKEIAAGLGFVGPTLFIDQHVITRGRFGRMLPAMTAAGYGLGLGVDEDTALVVKDGMAEVVGRSGAILVDLRSAIYDTKARTFQLQRARLSYLGPGDRVDIRNGSVTVAASRRADVTLDHRSSEFRPEHRQPYFSWDILGHDALTDLLFHLIDSSQTEAVGVALTRPDPSPAHLPPVGFEFRFRKGEDTIGYLSTASGADEFTVLNVYLDVRPIAAAAQPVYRRR